jgi:excisionase family DNA binding protein
MLDYIVKIDYSINNACRGDNMNDDKVLTIKEVSRLLRVSHTTVIRLVETGKIVPVYRVGNQYRIPQSSLDDYLKRASQ